MESKKAIDVVTGFTGTIVSRVEYLTGCTQYCLKPRIDKEGNPRDGIYFDEQSLEIFEDKPVEVKSTRTGGPQTDYPSH